MMSLMHIPSLSLAALVVLMAAIILARAGETNGRVLERPATGAGSVRLAAAAMRQESLVYKTLPQGELKLHFFFPADWQASDRRPGMIFFHGYSPKTGGRASVLFSQAEYFASRGMVCATADYRQPLADGWEPDGTVEDARSAMRWLRAHARELGVDPDKLIAGGGSWGGMLAANTALNPRFDAPADDLAVSCQPNAIVMFNPAVGLRPQLKNRAGEMVGDKIAPNLFIRKLVPPTIILTGTTDPIKWESDEFFAKSRELGNRCEYFTAADQGHGFFNKEPWTTATAFEVDRFLASLGYLTGPPALQADEKLLTRIP